MLPKIKYFNFLHSMMRKEADIFLRGILMGIADIIPGVSGGTIALIVGIYERIVRAVNGINVYLIKPLLRLNIRACIYNLKKVDFPFLIPLIAGIALSILSFSHLISFLLKSFAPITYAFFSGLIFSSAVIICNRIDKVNFYCLALLVGGVVFGSWVVGLTSLYLNHSLPVIFFSGCLAVCAMILPGISGSFILLILNQYECMIDALHYILLDRIISFIAGAILGVLSFARILEILLSRWRRETLSFLVGLMIGSLRLPIQTVVLNMESPIFPILSGIAGAVIAVSMELFSNKLLRA